MDKALSGIVGFILIIGTIVSNFIQFHKIIINKSIDGISITSLVMGAISSILTMYASILLNLDTINTFIIGLDVSQLILVCACSLIYLLIFMFYTKKPESNTFGGYSHINKEINIRKYKYIFVLFCSVWIILICFGTISIIIPHSETFINSMNILSTLISGIQYIPQIIKSYTSAVITNSLSLITLTLNIIGCIMTVIYQSVINGENILLMIPYIVAAILQILIILILKFKKPRILLDLDKFEIMNDDYEKNVETAV